MILPFEGQGTPQVFAATPNAPVAKKAETSQPPIGNKAPERKQLSQPSGKLMTNNIGIKETLNPTQRKKLGKSDEVDTNQKEDFTFEQLEYAWKTFSLAVKRQKRESFYSTLESSKMTMSSDYQIHLEIINTVQATELEREKGELLDFLRKELKNYGIGLKFTLIESEKVQILDNKGIFEKLAEENSSLNKFRKLFNLDIEF